MYEYQVCLHDGPQLLQLSDGPDICWALTNINKYKYKLYIYIYIFILSIHLTWKTPSWLHGPQLQRPSDGVGHLLGTDQRQQVRLRMIDIPTYIYLFISCRF